MVPQPQGAALAITNATVITMNDAFDIIEGDVVIRDGRIAAIGGTSGPVDRVIDAARAGLLRKRS